MRTITNLFIHLNLLLTWIAYCNSTLSPTSSVAPLTLASPSQSPTKKKRNRNKRKRKRKKNKKNKQKKAKSILADISNFKYNGAFRLPGDIFGESSIDYAVGVLALNKKRNSLFIVGHDHQNAIAEFPLDNLTLNLNTSISMVEELPMTEEPLQEFVTIFNKVENSQGINKITGMFIKEETDELFVNAENWYDAGGGNTDTTLIIQNSANLLESEISGFFNMECQAHCAGYMGAIPTKFQEQFHSSYFTGWSSVYSIVSRYSLGPSLWTFNTLHNIDQTFPFMNFPYGNGDSQTAMSLGALDYAAQGETGPFEPSDPLWNILSKGVYGFFIPNTDTFCVIGSTAGLETGIGYKAIQDTGYVCPGPCPYGSHDYSNYYWLFDVNEILKASNVWDPTPYAYGIWQIPFDNNGLNRIIGATFDSTSNLLYVALENAAQVGVYDRPPLIVTFFIHHL